MLKALAETGVVPRCRGPEMAVMVVTDSVPGCRKNYLATSGIRVVPLHILVDGIVCATVSIRSCRHPRPSASTAGATPAELCAAARTHAGDQRWRRGAGCAPVSRSCRDLLGRRGGRASAGDGVAVVDSRSAAMGTGPSRWPRRCNRRQRRPADRTERGPCGRRRTHAYIVVQRLDNLRRSGRLGGPAAWLGTALIETTAAGGQRETRSGAAGPDGDKAVSTMLDQVQSVVGDRSAAIVHHVADPGVPRGSPRCFRAAAAGLLAGDRHRPGSGTRSARGCQGAGRRRPGGD